MYSWQPIGPNFPCAATIQHTRDLPVFTQLTHVLKRQATTIHQTQARSTQHSCQRGKIAPPGTMAAATSSNTSTATLQIKHSSIEHTRKRIDPRRRQAALSFLSNISLDGRPVQDDADNQNEDESSLEARTRHSLVSPERLVYGAAAAAAAAPGGAAAAAAAAAAATTTAAQALAFANQALLHSSRASFGTGPAAGPAGTDADGDAFMSSMFSSPFSAVPASTRGRLQTYTQGILPAPYSRQNSQNYSLEGGQIANSAIELQRSR